jgi:hypothetical protein
MAKNPDFDAVLAQMESIHDSKNEDYAAGNNPYSNFEGTAAITGQSVDKVFQTMIGIKMERLKQLVGTDKEPNYESIDDTILDLANYAAIWLSYRQRQAYDFGPARLLEQGVISKRTYMEGQSIVTARTRVEDANPNAAPY